MFHKVILVVMHKIKIQMFNYGAGKVQAKYMDKKIVCLQEMTFAGLIPRVHYLQNWTKTYDEGVLKRPQEIQKM